MAKRKYLLIWLMICCSSVAMLGSVCEARASDYPDRRELETPMEHTVGGVKSFVVTTTTTVKPPTDRRIRRNNNDKTRRRGRRRSVVTTSTRANNSTRNRLLRKLMSSKKKKKSKKKRSRNESSSSDSSSDVVTTTTTTTTTTTSAVAARTTVRNRKTRRRRNPSPATAAAAVAVPAAEPKIKRARTANANVSAGNIFLQTRSGSMSSSMSSSSSSRASSSSSSSKGMGKKMGKRGGKRSSDQRPTPAPVPTPTVVTPTTPTITTTVVAGTPTLAPVTGTPPPITGQDGDGIVRTEFELDLFTQLQTPQRDPTPMELEAFRLQAVAFYFNQLRNSGMIDGLMALDLDFVFAEAEDSDDTVLYFLGFEATVEFDSDDPIEPSTIADIFAAADTSLLVDNVVENLAGTPLDSTFSIEFLSDDVTGGGENDATSVPTVPPAETPRPTPSPVTVTALPTTPEITLTESPTSGEVTAVTESPTLGEVTVVTEAPTSGEVAVTEAPTSGEVAVTEAPTSGEVAVTEAPTSTPIDVAPTDFVQFSTNLNGSAEGDASGSSVEISNDGQFLIIGEPLHDDGGDDDIGRIRVFALEDDDTFAEQGTPILGVAAGNQFGTSVSISQDGNRIVVGAIEGNGGSNTNTVNSGYAQVYELNGGAYTPLGPPLGGIEVGSRFGAQVAISADGTVVTVAAPEENQTSGTVRIYTLVDGAWEQFGDQLEGMIAEDLFGSSLTLSDDGSRLAVGAPRGGDFDVGQTGQVIVYESNGSDYEILGAEINGNLVDDAFGTAVALSGNGEFLAIGAPNVENTDIGDGEAAGLVQVYQFDSGEWTALGDPIIGENEGDLLGTAVDLNNQGTIVAVGEPGQSDSQGRVRTFTLEGSTWEQQGSSIAGEAEDNQAGTSVSLSSTGGFLATGSPGNSDAGDGAGHTRVFSFPV